MNFVCKNCGNTIFNKNDMGREKNGSINFDFCSSCYKNGELIKNKNEEFGEDFTFLPGLPSFDASIGNLSEGTNENMSAVFKARDNNEKK